MRAATWAENGREQVYEAVSFSSASALAALYRAVKKMGSARSAGRKRAQWVTVAWEGSNPNFSPPYERRFLTSYLRD